MEENADMDQDQKETIPENQITIDEQKPSPGEENKSSEIGKPSLRKEQAEDFQKDRAETEPEEQTTEDEPVPSQEEENKPSVRVEKSETLEVVRDSPKDQAETAAEEQTTVDEQTPSPGEETKPSNTEEPAKTPNVQEIPEKDKTETAPEEQTSVNGQTPSPGEEGKPSDKEEAAKSPEDEGDSQKDEEENVQEEPTTAAEQMSSPGEENKPTETEQPSKTLLEEEGIQKVRHILQKPVFITATVVILIAIIWSSIRNISKVDTPDKPAERCDPRKGDCSQFLSQSIQNLVEKYKDQESNSWRTLHAAALSHVSLKPKPVRPIVILVYWVNASNSQILFDISKVYSSVLSGSKDDANITILGKDFVNREPESVQKLIAERLEHGFKDGKKVAIIHDFDNLPSCSVLTFHNYCNNEDAPYTNVAIILTMTGNPEMEPGQKPKVLEESVSTIFHKKWSDCPDDLPPGKIDAILSRVANNVVLLR